MCGTKFADFTEVMDKVAAVHRKWTESLMPCLQEVFIEQNLLDEDDAGIYMHILSFKTFNNLLHAAM